MLQKQREESASKDSDQLGQMLLREKNVKIVDWPLDLARWRRLVSLTRTISMMSELKKEWEERIWWQQVHIILYHRFSLKEKRDNVSREGFLKNVESYYSMFLADGKKLEGRNWCHRGGRWLSKRSPWVSERGWNSEYTSRRADSREVQV